MTTQTTEQLITAVEQASSANGLLEAVKALALARTPLAIPTLIQVLGYNNPGAAVAAVEGLIELGEVVVPHLLQQVDDYNYGARAWAIRVFAGIGDPSALDLLLNAASNDFSLSVRRAAAKGLGRILWSKLPPEKISQAQNQVLETLLFVTEDSEWVVRYAAVVGLESLLLTQPNFATQIHKTWQQMVSNDPELVVRARVQLAINQVTQHMAKHEILA